MLDRGVLDDVQGQRRLSHRWPGGDNDQIGALETCRETVEIGETARHAGDRARPRLELLDPLHGRPDELFDTNELLGTAELRHLEHPVLGVVEHLSRGPVSFVDVLDDSGRGVHQPAQHRLVADDLGVVVDVRGGRDDVDQCRDVLHPAGTIEVAAPAQLVAQRDGIDDVAALGQREHRPEQQAMALLVEHCVVQDLGGLERRILVEQHRA